MLRPNLDLTYLTGLSDDATPTLVDELPKLDLDQRETLERHLAPGTRRSALLVAEVQSTFRESGARGAGPSFGSRRA